jgi:hypothetical protein
MYNTVYYTTDYRLYCRPLIIEFLFIPIYLFYDQYCGHKIKIIKNILSVGHFVRNCQNSRRIQIL